MTRTHTTNAHNTINTNAHNTINGDVSINVIMCANPRRKSRAKKGGAKEGRERQDDYRGRQLNNHGIVQKNVRIPANDAIETAFERLAVIAREGNIPPESFLKLVELAEDPSFIYRHGSGHHQSLFRRWLKKIATFCACFQ